MKAYRSYEDLPRIKLPLGQEVFISDSTIRDGSQMPGIVMKKKHKIQIFEYLNRIGIEKLETFVYNERDREAVREMLDRGYEFPEVTGWARANPRDIDFVLDMDGIKETGILMSVSDSHVIDKMGLKSREEAEKKYTEALQYAVDHGLRTRAHIEDMTRADNEGFVFPLVEKLLEIDPDCTIRLCDTLGYGMPFPEVDEPYGIPYIVKRLREIGTKNIETHVHDDYGMSVACSLAGYWYGANWSSLTFLGVGERAGNAELEKVALFLITRVEGFQKYDLRSITEFAEFMEKEIGIRVPRNKSVVGKNIFAHESGIHTAGVIKNPFTYEPYPPEIVGGKRLLMIGDSSGLEVIRFKVEEALNELMHVGIKLDKNDPRIKAIQTDIQKLYNEEKRVSAISDEELKKYVEKYFMLQPIIEPIGEEHSAEEPNLDKNAG
ncbi:homocitrate synthase/isopropylmalate synthase family protein [Candidatus Methanoperedens nitratireducens]|uniref:Pyruvate carboxyltransferase n=1 Tax=Candidatus Methanoperedens nitratireducens TaxID=1392998 RepID=A0A284VL75_9EURY|nr:isopropylmalate synthase [Candidatus Methanoperedens nitroreducens]SNQ60015.1 Pyruvate carboxyltransferase [Candidatus Methanoperedens nitroreducens]